MFSFFFKFNTFRHYTRNDVPNQRKMLSEMNLCKCEWVKPQARVNLQNDSTNMTNYRKFYHFYIGTVHVFKYLECDVKRKKNTELPTIQFENMFVPFSVSDSGFVPWPTVFFHHHHHNLKNPCYVFSVVVSAHLKHAFSPFAIRNLDLKLKWICMTLFLFHLFVTHKTTAKNLWLFLCTSSFHAMELDQPRCEQSIR